MNDLDLNKKLLNLMESTMMEKAKPDYIDLDKDGDTKEPMKKAAKDAQAKKMDEAEEKDGKIPSKSHIMKMCKDGKSKKEICDMHPECDQKELKDMINDCMEEHKEKTDESVVSLSDSLKQKLSAVMETSEEVTEASEEELWEEQDLDAESVAEQEEVTEDESLDEMAELLRMAGLGEGTASCTSMPRTSMPTTGPEQVNGYEGDFVGEEDEHDANDHGDNMDDEAGDAEEKVTHEIELDRDEHEAMKSLLKKLLDA